MNNTNKILTDGFSGIQSDLWHGRNAEIIWKGSNGFQFVTDDSLFLGCREKGRDVTCEKYHSNLNCTKWPKLSENTTLYDYVTLDLSRAADFND